MKQKIKTWLIHKLGGVTIAEREQGANELCETVSHIGAKLGYYTGRNDAFLQIRDYAKAIYGTAEWGQQVWNYINAQIKE